jgi:hypothetical protein
VGGLATGNKKGATMDTAIVIAIATALLGVIQYLCYEKLKALWQRETGEVLERMRWDFKVREQAAKVAEYMALKLTLTDESSAEDYAKANRLSWELAMWLPSDVYKELTQAMFKPTQQVNALTVTIAVRKLLLGKTAGDLNQEQILMHGRGIGEKPSQPSATP